MNILNLLKQWDAAIESLQRNAVSAATDTRTLDSTLQIRTGLKVGQTTYGPWNKKFHRDGNGNELVERFVVDHTGPTIHSMTAETQICTYTETTEPGCG